jgi:LPXTG-motif cell wall-anchored protein
VAGTTTARTGANSAPLTAAGAALAGSGGLLAWFGRRRRKSS